MKQIFSLALIERIDMDLRGLPGAKFLSLLESAIKSRPSREFETNTLAFCYDEKTDTISIADQFCSIPTEMAALGEFEEFVRSRYT